MLHSGKRPDVAILGALRSIITDVRTVVGADPRYCADAAVFPGHGPFGVLCGRTKPGLIIPYRKATLSTHNQHAGDSCACSCAAPGKSSLSCRCLTAHLCPSLKHGLHAASVLQTLNAITAQSWIMAIPNQHSNTDRP